MGSIRGADSWSERAARRKIAARGEQGSMSTLPQYKSHHWSKKINAQLVVTKARSRLAPDASGASVHQKARAVAIGQLEKSAVGKFGNNKRTISWKKRRGPNTNGSDWQQLRLGGPVGNGRKVELNVGTRHARRHGTETCYGKVGLKGQAVGAVGLSHVRTKGECCG